MQRVLKSVGQACQSASDADQFVPRIASVSDLAVPVLPPELLDEIIRLPSLPDPAASANVWDAFGPRYLAPLYEALGELARLCRVSRALRAKAQPTLDSVLVVSGSMWEARGETDGVVKAARRLDRRKAVAGRIRHCYVASYDREYVIGGLVSRCDGLEALVSSLALDVTLPPSCTTVIMPSPRRGPAKLLAAISDLRCLRMVGLAWSQLDAVTLRMVSDCPSVQISCTDMRRGIGIHGPFATRSLTISSAENSGSSGSDWLWWNELTGLDAFMPALRELRLVDYQYGAAEETLSHFPQILTALTIVLPARPMTPPLAWFFDRLAKNLSPVSLLPNLESLTVAHLAFSAADRQRGASGRSAVDELDTLRAVCAGRGIRLALHARL